MPLPSKRIRTFRFHPNVVRNWLEHHSRVKDQAAHCGDISLSEDVPKMSGCVIGIKNGQTVEILDSLDLLFDPDPVSGTLCRALLQKKEHYNQLFPHSVVLGWYSSETRSSAVQDTDMQIHKALMDTEGRAFCLLLNLAINLSEIDLRVTLYDCVLRDTNGGPKLNLLKFKCSIEYLDLERISVDRSTGFKQCILCPNRAVSDVNLLALEKKEGVRHIHQALRMMLLETPSGFAMFSVSARFLTYPEEIWAWFTSLSDAHDVVYVYSSFWTAVGHFLCCPLLQYMLQPAVSLLGFIQVEDKSVARKSDVGPGEDLEKFIRAFMTTHKQALIVPDKQLQFVIEKNLNIICWFDAPTVHELKWGLGYVLDEFVPAEKECDLYLSDELEKKIKAYGFSVSPRMIDRKFINTVGELYKVDLTSESLSMFLHYNYPGIHMPDKDFAEAIADNLKSSEEMIPKYGEYGKQDILRFTKFLLEAPVLKNDAISRLKCMLTAAGSAEAKDKEPKLLATV